MKTSHSWVFACSCFWDGYTCFKVKIAGMIYCTFEKNTVTSLQTLTLTHYSSLHFLPRFHPVFRQKLPLIIVHHAKFIQQMTILVLQKQWPSVMEKYWKPAATMPSSKIWRRRRTERRRQNHYPGFIDAHAHFVGFAFGLGQVNLLAHKAGECIDRIKHLYRKERYSRCMDTGPGLDQGNWDIKEFPTKALLDSSFPNNPGCWKGGWSCAVANQKPLNWRCTDRTKHQWRSVETINGTGIFIDNAESLLQGWYRLLIKPIYQRLMKQQNCFAVGLTSVQDCIK